MFVFQFFRTMLLLVVVAGVVVGFLWVSYAAVDFKALRAAIRPRLGAFSKSANNQLRQPTSSFDRARHDPYIYLVQPLGVKSTIQNFDEADGKIKINRLWVLTQFDSTLLAGVFPKPRVFTSGARDLACSTDDPR